MKNWFSLLLSHYRGAELRYGLRPLRGVLIFVLLTLIIHFAFRYWVTLDYFPLGGLMHKVYAVMIDVVLSHSLWFIRHVLGYNPALIDHTMYFGGAGYIAINEGCAGLKQFLQVSLLFAFYPGPWKHKLWFIPLGILLMHATNLFRIVGLAEVLHQWPHYWKFSHDYIFRPLFYVVIFAMWVVWEERFAWKTGASRIDADNDIPSVNS
ncbi:MAG: archaeosortase/exosortase family protein [Bacteroidales bacterium]